MPRHNVTRLETVVKQVRADIRRLGAREDLIETLRYIRKPGWTTPAEFRLTMATAQAMQSQVKVLGELQKTLVAASREIAAASARPARSR